MDAGTELILVRHGETDWNRAQRIQGHTDIALNETGLRQARAVARRLAAERIDAVVSSDLLRARQTAEAIAQACKLEPVLEARLRERAFGAFEGCTHAQLQRERPRDYARWKAREPDFDLPMGGESLATLQARIDRVLRELAARYAGRRIVAVAHGGVLDAARRLTGELPLQAPRAFDLLNASINRLRVAHGRFEVAGWADVAHLQSSLDDVEPVAPSRAG